MAKIKENQEYFKKNLDKESYDFLVQLVESGKNSWEDIKNKVKIENKEIVWEGNLDIKWTKVKKIKAKRIEGNINVYGVETLKDIEVEEEIGGDLNIIWTNVDFQLKIIEKIRSGELKVKGEVYDNI